MSDVETKNITAICPICEASARIPVPKAVIKGKTSGTTSVHVPAKLVCEHEFYVYVDRNFIIRDYMVADIQFYSEKDIYEKAKHEILENLITLAPTAEKIYKSIRKDNFLSLLFAAFIKSPIILLVNEIEEEDFKMVLSGLGAFYPTVAQNLKISAPEKYLDIEKNQSISIESATVYNVSYQLSVKKPFRDSDAEVFGPIVELLKEEKFKLTRVHAKNHIDIMDRYYQEFKKFDQKDREDTQRAIKALTKVDATNKDKITSDWVGVFNRRLEFETKYPETNN